MRIHERLKKQKRYRTWGPSSAQSSAPLLLTLPMSAGWSRPEMTKKERFFSSRVTRYRSNSLPSTGLRAASQDSRLTDTRSATRRSAKDLKNNKNQDILFSVVA